MEATKVYTSTTASLNGSSTPSTKGVFEEFKKELWKKDIPAAHSSLASAITTDRSNKKSRHNKRCFLLKADDTLKVYQKIHNSIMVYALQDGTSIKANIAEYVAESTDITTKLNETLALIKAAKAKTNEAKSIIGDLKTAIDNSSFSEQVNILESIVKDNDNNSVFKKSIDSLYHNTIKCVNLIDDAVEVGVKVVGINAGANIGSLTAPGEKLVTCLTDLDKDISANITSATNEKTVAQTYYTGALNTLSIGKYAKYKATLIYGALLDTVNWSIDCKCELTHEDMKIKLDELACKVEQHFFDTL